MIPLHRTFFGHVAIAVVSALISGSAYATIIASDSFSITSNRATGSSVSGSQTEVGEQTWNGSEQFVVLENENNGYLGTKGSTSAGIGIPFDLNTHQSKGHIATLSASIAYRRDNNEGRWFALGFGPSTLPGGLPSAIYLRVNTYMRTWQLVSSGNSDLPSGEIADINYTASAPVTYSLTYDNDSTTVIDVSINGTSVLSNYKLPNPPREIQSAGFWSQLPYNTPTGIIFDNFELSVSSSPKG